MFTGLVADLGEITGVERSAEGVLLELVQAPPDVIEAFATLANASRAALKP